ncbi:MAG: iron-containing redox enzyme family protein [Armatimonadetes bacterium]|nr:iron-containing redox enzyme family protein [Armatimonadota bacterium]
MSLRARLDAVIDEHNLLNHPFYQAWSAGTLPVEALKAYSNDWAAFIGKVPKGWAAHGDEAIAAEETEHRQLWEQFANGLGVTTGEATTPEVQELANTVDVLFGDAATSLGSLYAFEAQQPHTSKSKLEGLRKHYDVGEQGEEYFVVHETDFAEPALLLERMESLSSADQERAVAACEATAKALWNGLSGLYRPYESACAMA